MDIFAILTQDHRQVMKLLAALAAARPGRLARTEILVELQALLLAHHNVEEALFGAMPTNCGAFGGSIARALRRQIEGEELLAALCGLRDDDGWQDGVLTLRHALERQFADEEQVLYPAARRWLDDRKLQHMVAELRSDLAMGPA